MVNKFLVFVVFAIVTQSSVLLSSATFNDFPEEGHELLTTLQSCDYAARNKSISGFSWFADLLKNGTGQTSSHQDLSPYVDALSVVVESTDIVYYSALLVSNGDCGFETALNKTRDQLREVIELLISSIALAKGGNYDENRSEIEHNRDSTAPVLVSAYGTLFEFFRCCIGDSGEEFETLIGKVQAKVNENLHLRTDALYKAIEAYSILTSECSEDEAAAALACIDESLIIILATAIDNIEHIFSLYETSYIVTYINGDEIAQGVFYIRLARKTTADKFDDVLEAVFAGIKGRLLENIGYPKIEGSNSTVADPTQAVALSSLQSVVDNFLATVLLTLSNRTDLVIIDKLLMPDVLRAIIGNIYYGMEIAEAGLPEDETLLAIGILVELEGLFLDLVVENWFGIIGSDADTEARLAELENRQRATLQEGGRVVFNGIEVLSRAAHATDGASQEDFNDIETYRSLAISLGRDVVMIQYAAVLYKYIVESGY